MKKTVIALNGSPRPDSNTARMLAAFTEAAAKYGIGVTTVELRKMKPAMCLGCLSCFKSGRCVHNDGLNELMAQIEAADGIVAASPVYYGSVTAQLKAVMDRIAAFRPGEIVALTFTPEFFGSMGFAEIPKTKIMHKLYTGCINCTKHDNPYTCPETAMVYKGKMEEGK